MKKTLLVLSLLTLASCAKQTVYVSDKPIGKEVEKTNHFFFWGIAQSSKMDVARICKGRTNVSKVESRMSGGQSLAVLFTLGIYTPMTSKVSCSE